MFGGLGANGTARRCARLSTCVRRVIIGFGGAAQVVLEQGHVIDTVVHGHLTPLSALPRGSRGWRCSRPGLCCRRDPEARAASDATMPIVVPLATARHPGSAVLAFQYGEGVTNFVWPTQATLVAVIATARLPFDRWLRFILPYFAQIVLLAIVGILVAHAIGLGPR